MKSFGELLSLHRELDDLFLAHQRALIRSDFPRALRHLDEYEAALAAHMRDEEERLIPLYAERAGYIRGGAAELFLGEHRKMRRLVARFKEAIPRVAGAADVERALLGLLDEQATFKHLCEHHDAREGQILYPALDRVTSDEEKIRLGGELKLRVPDAAQSVTAQTA